MPASSAIGELVLKFTADIADVLTNTEKIRRDLEGLGASVTSAISGIKNAIAGVGSAFAVFETVKTFQNIITESVEAQAQLEKLSITTGLSVETLSGLSNAAAQVGLSIQDTSTLLVRFGRNVNDAASGGGKAAEALKSLGFSAQDLAEGFKAPDQLLLDVIKKVEEAGTGFGHSAALIEIFGRSAAQLAPLFRAIAENGELVSTVTAAQAKYAEAVTQAWNKFRNDVQQVVNQMVAQWLPVFTSLIKTLTDMFSAAYGAGEGIKGLVEGGKIREWAVSGALAVTGLIDTFLTWKNAFSDVGTLLRDLGAILADFGQIALGVGQILSGNISDGFENVSKGIDNAKADFAKFQSDWSDGFKKSTAATDAFLNTLIKTDLEIGKMAETPTKVAERIQKAAAETGKLAAAQDAYAKALAGVAKAGVEALLKIEQEGLKESLAAAKRQYDQGITDFQAYYDKQFQIEVAGLALQEDALKKELAAQQTLVDQIQSGINNLDPNKFKNITDYQVALTKAETQLAEAQKGLVDIGGKLVVVQQQETQVGKDYIEKYLIPANRLILESIPALQQKIDAQQLENESIGATASQIQLLLVARLEDLRAVRESQLASLAELEYLDKVIEKRRELAGVLQRGEDIRSQITAWGDVLNEAETVFTNILTDGKNTWSQLTQWLKDTLIKELFKLAATKFIIPLIVDITGNAQLGNALGNQIGGGFLNALTGGGSGGGGAFGSIINTIFGVGSEGGALGIVGAGTGEGLGALGSAAQIGADALGSLGGAIGSMLPYVGLVVAGLGLLGSTLFKHEPSQTQGQFGIRGPGSSTSEFEDQASVSSKLGGLMIGFLDQGTKYFSGDAAKVFDNIVSGALDAFNSRFSKEQSDQLATILKNMTFQAFEGTYSTQDFIQKYGGQILQQVVQAAFSVLDPALASVEAGFSGTADEVVKFTNTLLAIYDVGQNLGSGFQDKLAAAFGDTTSLTADQLQALAEKILGFAAVVGTFGDKISGLGAQLQALDPSVITAFVDALGGAQAAIDKYNFIYQNFVSSTQKAIDATNTLNADFTKLGVTSIPQTHQQFLDLLSSIDLSTDAGRQLYNSLLELAPLFIQVHGTADQASNSLGGVSDALDKVSQSAVDFFNKNFFSEAEQQAKQLAADQKAVADAEAQLGVHIPTTIQGFRDLVASIDTTTDDGKKLYAALIQLAPAIFDIAKASTTAATAITTAADAINSASSSVGESAGDSQNAAKQFVNSFLTAIKNLASSAPGSDLGDQLGLEINLITSKIGDLNSQLAAHLDTTGGIWDDTAERLSDEIAILEGTGQKFAGQLADFTILKAQYGSEIAGQLIDLETWYNDQAKALGNNADALAALKTIFDAKWQDIINGTSSGVDGVQSKLQQLIQNIKDFIKQLTISDLSPLTPLQKLQEAQKQYNDELALAQGGNQDAIANITKYAQAYLQQARAVDASSQAYTDIFNSVVSSLTALENIGGTIISDPNFPGAPGLGGTPPEPPPGGFGNEGPGTGGGGHGGGGKGKGPPTDVSIAALAAAIIPGTKLATSEDSSNIGQKLDKLNAEVLSVRDAILASSTAHKIGTDKHIAAADKHTQQIISNLGRHNK